MAHSVSKYCYSVSDLSKDYSFNGIDLMKFLCAYMILAFHVKPLYSDTVIANNINFWLRFYLFKIAVPFYFTVSGFMLFRKIDIYALDFNIIKKYCFKLLRLHSTWYFLLIVGWKGHLWYIEATVLAVILLSVLIRANFKIQHIFLIAFVLYIIGLLGDSYYSLLLKPLENHSIIRSLFLVYENLFQTTRNGVFFGFIFVVLGALFAHKRIIMNKVVAILGLMVSMALLFAEVYIIHYCSVPRDINMYFFLIPVIFFVFYCSSHIKLKNSIVFFKLRVIGMLIYYLHIFVAFFVNLGIKLLERYGIEMIRLKCIFVIVIVTLLAVILEELAQTKNFRWLRYLYS